VPLWLQTLTLRAQGPEDTVLRAVEVIRDLDRAPTETLERVPCAPRFMTYGCALGVDSMATAIRVGERTVRLGAHPVGINTKSIEEILNRDDVREKLSTIRNELGGRTTILSIERLDYVKGPLEKLEAFEKMLENHPELHGEVIIDDEDRGPHRQGVGKHKAVIDSSGG
jgi:hypothetical protein